MSTWCPNLADLIKFILISAMVLRLSYSAAPDLARSTPEGHRADNEREQWEHRPSLDNSTTLKRIHEEESAANSRASERLEQLNGLQDLVNATAQLADHGSLKSVRVKDSIDLSGHQSLQSITISDCLIEGSILLELSRIPGKLQIQNCVIRGTLNLANAEIAGGVIIRNCSIGAGLIVTYNRPGYWEGTYGIDASWAKLGGPVWIRDSEVYSTMRLHTVVANGGVRIEHSRFITTERGEDRPAIDLNYASIPNLFILDANVAGGVRGVGSTIGHTEIEYSAIAPNIARQQVYAVMAPHLVGRYFRIQNCSLDGAIELAGSSLDFCGLLGLVPGNEGSYAIQLSHARIRKLADDEETIDGADYVDVHGMQYAGLHEGSIRGLDRVYRWIQTGPPARTLNDGDSQRGSQDNVGEKNPLGSASSYEQYARLLDSEGRNAEARKVRYLMRSEQTSNGGWDRVHRRLTGYGYLPERILIFLAALWSLCWLFLMCAKRGGALRLKQGAERPSSFILMRRNNNLVAVQTPSGEGDPRGYQGWVFVLSSAIHAVDVVVPFSKLLFEDRWRYDLHTALSGTRTTAVVHGAIAACGWFFTVLALSGVLKMVG